MGRAAFTASRARWKGGGTLEGEEGESGTRDEQAGDLVIGMWLKGRRVKGRETFPLLANHISRSQREVMLKMVIVKWKPLLTEPNLKMVGKNFT